MNSAPVPCVAGAHPAKIETKAAENNKILVCKTAEMPMFGSDIDMTLLD